MACQCGGLLRWQPASQGLRHSPMSKGYLEVDGLHCPVEVLAKLVQFKSSQTDKKGPTWAR